ncbi:MAG: tetraacyldisaccharide 4'-kinase [Gemmataceae bacterium]|nr:tetraacyldisaccharide 4'-kinase [Gemmata sp.]MDW8197452.1 tetraacyldisaccharide 4'-kinase [Gemmataceae bacterium]
MASGPYALGVRLRNWLYDRGWKRVHTALVPVVSIGNLSVGGTGKTPCVEWVARFYRQRDLRVAIISRGYKAENGRNDEAMVLEDNLPDVPHLQNPDRVAAAEMAVAELESELLILDDGFQHRRLHRDIDLVLIDATRPPQRDHLFPWGTLREPVSSLRRASAFILTRCDQAAAEDVAALAAWLRSSWPEIPIATSEHRPRALIGAAGAEQPPSWLAGKTVAAFCGIGHPAAFQATLAAWGAKVVAFRRYPDHHRYRRADVDDLTVWAAAQPADAVIVTTQKDWVKLRVAAFAQRPLWAVQIGLHMRSGEEALAAVLEKPLHECAH